MPIAVGTWPATLQTVIHVECDGAMRTSWSRCLSLAMVVATWFATAAMAADAPSTNCGGSPSDWCPAPAGDPCGAHKDAASCKADTACYGMQYSGESMVACQFDERGFGSNCPTVGCTSVPPKKPQ